MPCRSEAALQGSDGSGAATIAVLATQETTVKFNKDVCGQCDGLSPGHMHMHCESVASVVGDLTVRGRPGFSANLCARMHG